MLLPKANSGALQVNSAKYFFKCRGLDGRKYLFQFLAGLSWLFFCIVGFVFLGDFDFFEGEVVVMGGGFFCWVFFSFFFLFAVTVNELASPRLDCSGSVQSK